MGGGIGGILYAEDGLGGSHEFFVYNAIGSVVALTDGQANLTSTSDFDAFGNVLSQSGLTCETRKFCTKERSPALNLDNFGHRYYDPALGRFLTRDPAGYPNGPNNYLYCANNPVNRIAPLGLYMFETTVVTNIAINYVSRKLLDAAVETGIAVGQAVRDVKNLTQAQMKPYVSEAYKWYIVPYYNAKSGIYKMRAVNSYNKIVSATSETIEPSVKAVYKLRDEVNAGRNSWESGSMGAIIECRYDRDTGMWSTKPLSKDRPVQNRL